MAPRIMKGPRLLRNVIVPLMILLLVALAGSETRAQPAGTGYSLAIEAGRVAVSLNINIAQNLTASKDSFALPTFHSLVDETNSSTTTQALETAIQMKTPGARVAGLRLEATSTAWSNQTRLQWFNLSLAFNVAGVSADRGGAVKFDMSWKSFAVTSAVSLSGFEVNKIGSSYLVGVAEELSSEASSSSIVRTAFHADGRSIQASNFGEAVRGVSTLNFSSFATPVVDWGLTLEPFSNQMSLSFSPKHSFGMDLSVTISEEPDTPPTTIAYGVLYSLEATITAPRRSTLSGDIVTVVFDETAETLMGVTILSSASLGLVTFVYERRVTRKRAGKPRRNKP